MESRPRDLVDDLDPKRQMARLNGQVIDESKTAALLRGQRSSDVGEGGMVRKDIAGRLVRGVSHAW